MFGTKLLKASLKKASSTIALGVGWEDSSERVIVQAALLKSARGIEKFTRLRAMASVDVPSGQ